jgi:hypothetical protein
LPSLLISSHFRVSGCSLLLGAMVASFGGCAQQWTFYHPDLAGTNVQARDAAEKARSPAVTRVDPQVRPASFEEPTVVPNPAPAPALGTASEGPPPAWLPPPQDDSNPGQFPLVERLPPVGEPPVTLPPNRLGGPSRLLDETLTDLWCDANNYYVSWPTWRDFALGFGVAAVVANTRMDEDFQDYYQREVRSSTSNHIAKYAKMFGEGSYVIPTFAVMGVAGRCLEGWPVAGTAGEWGDRVTRAYLIGGPPMLLMQKVTGSSRPEEVEADSRWRPWKDSNGVSGHAFIGAVPFITAAQMVENPWAKGLFFACSFMPAWSRVNDDNHYLSQAGAGWWMAYLACRAVNTTETKQRNLSVVPIATPEMSGIGLEYRR